MWSHRWEVAPRDVGVVGSVYIGMTGMLSHYWRHSCRAGSITPAVVCTICSRALSSLFYLAELSCQPEGHGHLAASCLSTYLHAHTRTERVMVLIEERPSLPPNRACLRCNRTHTRTCKISACCVCIASTFLASTSSCTLLAAVEGGPAAPAASADPPPSRSLVPSISTPAPVNICVTHLRDAFVQKSAKPRQS